MVALDIFVVDMGYLRDPEAAVGQHQHVWVIDKHILVNEEKYEADVDS